MLSMIVAGMLASRVDGRLLLMLGFFIQGVSTLMLSHVNLGISMTSVIVPNVLNGFASGFIFVPLTMMAMGRLRKQEIGNAAGIYNLVRNIGGSIGIATATALLVRKGQAHQTYLAANLTASDSVAGGVIRGLEGKMMLAGSDAFSAHQQALGAIYRMVQQQASLLAYVDNFRLLGFMSLLCIPIVLLFQGVRKQP
jgi:DHA2 family multidrug resistance protein